MKNTPKTQRQRIGRLKTAQDVAKYMARCIRRGEKGEGDAVNRYYKLTMMASMMLKAFEAGDMEQRIKTLEERSGMR
jgi:hypothetical protein